MGLVLGIDTGGTFTDAVIWDSAKEEVKAKSKAFTTSYDLNMGINNCLNQLKPYLNKKITAVHLSTTLAVNSILENKMPKTGLVILGKHTNKKFPVSHKCEIVNYKYNSQNESCTFDSETKHELCKIFNEDVAYILVAASHKEEYKDMELAALNSLSKILTAKIISCSQIDNSKDIYSRIINSSTVIGLRHIISEWGKCMKDNLIKYNINAPIKILTGKGTLITFENAIANPLETIMSGPAASFIGSTYLTDEKDYLLLDMGGTSVDITKVRNRKTRFAKDKRTIGEYNYNLSVLDIQSFGTGGDSIIKLNSLGAIVIGPDKVMPLCVLGANHPHLNTELKQFKLQRDYDLLTAAETDCYFVDHKIFLSTLERKEAEIIKLLLKNPHSLFYLADYFNVDADALHMDKLVKKGLVRRASLTPTDILHAEGSFCRWNVEITKTAVELLAERLYSNSEDVILQVKKLVTEKLAFACMQSIAGFERKNFLFNESEASMYLINKFLHKSTGLIDSNFEIKKPIIGVGAPARAWLKPVAEKLNSHLIVPYNGDVACAIGAAAGKVK